MYMDDLSDLTKDYFKKSKEERIELLDQFYVEILNMVIENNVDKESLERHFDKIIRMSLEEEEYEISQLMLEIKKRFEEINYGM
jgi:ribosome maturation protein Sdo1